MKKQRELIMEGGRAFRLRKKPSSIEESSKGMTCLLPNLLVMKSEPSDRPVQTKKRWGKLKWLITNIPKEGAKAQERLKAR